MANNSNRKAIEFMVQGALPPHSTNVLWMDTSVPTLPVLKIFENGAWTTVHTEDGKAIELLSKTVLAQQREITELTENIKSKMALDATVAKDSTVAKQQTLTQGVSDIREDIAHIDIDISDLAKQGTNPNATLSEVQTQATSASTDAAAAKTAAQAITGYALQGDNEAATNTAILAEIKSISAVNRAMTLNRGGELKDYTIFFDIDGTILYAFTHDEIMQLTELPEPYVYHDRLTFDRWSYTLEELRQANGWRDVGAHYYPTDGFGEFELDYRNCKSLTPHIGVKLRTSDGLIVDWGDGNVETLPAALEFDLQHTYAVPSKYLMRWKQENDAKIYGVYVWNDTKSKVVGRCVYPTNAETLSCSPLSTQTENTNAGSAQGIGLTMIEELAIPYSCVLADSNVSSGLYFNMPLLKAVSGDVGLGGYFDIGTYTPDCSKELGSALFVSFRNVPPSHYVCCSPAFARSFFLDTSLYRIPHLVNNNIERVATALTANITELTTMNVITAGKLRAIPAPVAPSYGERYIVNCKYLEVTPDLSNYSFGTSYGSYVNNYKIRDYGKKWEISNVKANCFENNYSLLTFTISNITTKINADAFLNCFSLEEFHVERSSVVDGSITALANVSAFSGCPSTMKIYVPADSVEAYKAATNWSTYASQIFAEPETE